MQISFSSCKIQNCLKLTCTVCAWMPSIFSDPFHRNDMNKWISILGVEYSCVVFFSLSSVYESPVHLAFVRHTKQPCVCVCVWCCMICIDKDFWIVWIICFMFENRNNVVCYWHVSWDLKDNEWCIKQWWKMKQTDSPLLFEASAFADFSYVVCYIVYSQLFSNK